jgi:CRISPR/Cas system-associated endonuclease Cas1
MEQNAPVVNALLNYAYALLRSVVHTEIVAAGFDPRRGIMHHDCDEADAFAFLFDVMEPGRPAVNAAVLNFLRQYELTGADFVLRSDGVCRVAPQLVRAVATSVLIACAEAEVLRTLGCL